MSYNIDYLLKIAADLINPSLDERKKLKILNDLLYAKITIEQLQKSRLGKSVKRCTKIDGETGAVAKKVIKMWAKMIDQHCKDKEENIEKTSGHITSEEIDLAQYKEESKFKNVQTENNTDVISPVKIEKHSLKRKSTAYDSFSEYKKANNFENDFKSKQLNEFSNEGNSSVILSETNKKTKVAHQTNERSVKNRRNEQPEINRSKHVASNIDPFESIFNNSLSTKTDKPNIDSFESIYNNKLSSKTEKSAIDPFESIFNNKLSYKSEKTSQKHKSPQNFDTEQNYSNTTFIPDALPDLPTLNKDQYNVSLRSDVIESLKQNQEHKDLIDSKSDVDVTSKYSSVKKVWVPKSKNSNNEDLENSPENSETINGVLVSDIATFSAKQLLSFEGDNRKIMRQTKLFWEKLFHKNHKSASRFENEKWRDAYLRVESEAEEKLRKISERLNKKTEINKKNESRAKMIQEPFKVARRSYGGGFRR